MMEFVNPAIIKTEGSQEGTEGCLSYPGEYGMVARPNSVTVRACDRKGREFSYTGTELMARALCHETDHLDGRLFTDIATEMLKKEDVPKR